MSAPTYHSVHGGFWIDRSDWRQEMDARGLDEEKRKMVTDFVTNGYLILPGAASNADIDAFQARISQSFRDGNPLVRYQPHDSPIVLPLKSASVNRLGTRIVDSFVPFNEALELFQSPKLNQFLELIFEGPALLFQSLSFDQGSQQGLHRDTAYVVVNRPIELAACWIALEDIEEGSGELMYVPGSHRDDEYLFKDGRKHWVAPLDGPELHDEWSRHIHARAADNPNGKQTFRAKKGDILIWHADLAHGGAPVTNPELTRQSLVGHFCPLSARPHYFSLGINRDTIKTHGRLHYASFHYDLGSSVIEELKDVDA